MECKLNVAVAVERCGLAGVWGGVCARNEKSARRFQEHTGGSDGKYPWTAGVAIGSGPSGHPVLYGTTNYGGTTSCYLGCGTVFSLTPPASPGGSWTEAVLYSFQGTPGDGANPYAGLRSGSGGVLYGTTQFGGTTSNGTVFKLTP